MWRLSDTGLLRAEVEDLETACEAALEIANASLPTLEDMGGDIAGMQLRWDGAALAGRASCNCRQCGTLGCGLSVLAYIPPQVLRLASHPYGFFLLYAAWRAKSWSWRVCRWTAPPGAALPRTACCPRSEWGRAWLGVAVPGDYSDRAGKGRGSGM